MRACFWWCFHFDRTVSPAPDEATSMTATGASLEQGGAAFTTTHWTVVLEAQGESPAAQGALEKLCRTYWRPIFAFLRRQGIASAEAEDITQGFFAQLLERRSLNAVRKEKGRLRSYLLGALKYFLTDEQRRAMAVKRGRGQRLIPLEEFRADDRIEMEPADPVTAEMIYERRWALTVLERVISRL
jgi:DNA-directed RNA polymerase specialized sigma24 family protein